MAGPPPAQPAQPNYSHPFMESRDQSLTPAHQGGDVQKRRVHPQPDRLSMNHSHSLICLLIHGVPGLGFSTHQGGVPRNGGSTLNPTGSMQIIAIHSFIYSFMECLGQVSPYTREGCPEMAGPPPTQPSQPNCSHTFRHSFIHSFIHSSAWAGAPPHAREGVLQK